MIKLSDYLDYLNNEVIQARKNADEQCVEIAKQYASHEYLKYFTVPRFVMPSVKLNIPIKISELDSRVTYNFTRDYDTFVFEVNEKILDVNQKKNLNISLLNKDKLLNNSKIIELFDTLEKHDYKPVKKLEDNLAKIDINEAVVTFIQNINFSDSADSEMYEFEKFEYTKILRDSFTNRFKPIRANLNNIFIDPDTSKESDKGKKLLTLDVELIEEGIKIRKLKDENGNEVEEIIFE